MLKMQRQLMMKHFEQMVLCLGFKHCENKKSARDVAAVMAMKEKRRFSERQWWKSFLPNFEAHDAAWINQWNSPDSLIQGFGTCCSTSVILDKVHQKRENERQKLLTQFHSLPCFIVNQPEKELNILGVHLSRHWNPKKWWSDSSIQCASQSQEQWSDVSKKKDSCAGQQARAASENNF